MEGITLLGNKATQYPTRPEDAIIETFKNPSSNKYVIVFKCTEFTSLCPLTHQPDFATLEIEYMPNERCLESKSLKLFLFSFRNTGGFAEDLTNKILDRLVKEIQPIWMDVVSHFSIRGGIGIDVKASWPK